MNLLRQLKILQPAILAVGASVPTAEVMEMMLKTIAVTVHGLRQRAVTNEWGVGTTNTLRAAKIVTVTEATITLENYGYEKPRHRSHRQLLWIH